MTNLPFIFVSLPFLDISYECVVLIWFHLFGVFSKFICNELRSFLLWSVTSLYRYITFYRSTAASSLEVLWIMLLWTFTGRSLCGCRFSIHFSSVQSLSRVWLFATPWTAAHQASLSISNSQSLLKLMSIESVMSSNHLILCYRLLLPPSIFPSIRVFSNKSGLRIRWPKYWSFSFSISPSNEYSGLIYFRMDILD